MQLPARWQRRIIVGEFRAERRSNVLFSGLGGDNVYREVMDASPDGKEQPSSAGG